MIFDPENPFSELNKSEPRTMQIYFELESSHMPAEGYSKKSNMAIFRQEAFRLIKYHADHCSRDPVIRYLAVNYFDYFFSTHRLPQKVQGWGNNIRLVATCCFISAWRMRNTSNECLVKRNIDFKRDDLIEIETLIDQWLHMRNCKRPVTALCFLDFFIVQLTELTEDQIKRLKGFAAKIIFAQQIGMRFTEFKPSIMTVTALVFSSVLLYEEKVNYFIKTLKNCQHVNRESLQRAIYMTKPRLKWLHELVSEKNEASNPSSSSNRAEPIPLPPRNIDNATTEASVEPNRAPQLESLDSRASNRGLSSNAAMPILPPSLLPPKKRPFSAVDQETTDESSKWKGKKNLTD